MSRFLTHILLRFEGLLEARVEIPQMMDNMFIIISSIVVRYGLVIDSVTFDYVDADDSIQSTRHGGNGGDNTSEVVSKLFLFLLFLSYLSVS